MALGAPDQKTFYWSLKVLGGLYLAALCSASQKKEFTKFMHIAQNYFIGSTILGWAHDGPSVSKQTPLVPFTNMV